MWLCLCFFSYVMFHAKIVLIVVTVCFGVGRLGAQKQISNAELLALMKDYHIPTLGLGLIHKGKIKRVEILSNTQNKVSKASTLFNVASLTKPVVAMLTLQLVSKRLLRLDEPLYPYWVDPDVAQDPRCKKLTTRHILSHQSGFANWRSSHPAGKLVFHFEPGERFQYSGEGMEYLRRALEHKFGKSIEKLADSLLFDPLQMDNSHFYWSNSLEEARVAIGYDHLGNSLPFKKETEANAADDLLTTIDDYTKFASAVLKKFRLSKSVFREMTKAQSQVKDNVYMGLGWELYPALKNGQYAIMHRGVDSGTRCLVLLLPKSKDGLVILTNSDNGERIFNQLVKDVLPVGEEIVRRF